MSLTSGSTVLVCCVQFEFTLTLLTFREGHDNPSSLCTAGDVNLVLNFQLSDHAGPYDGVMMETCPR